MIYDSDPDRLLCVYAALGQDVTRWGFIKSKIIAATGCSSQESRLLWRDRHLSGERFHMWPTKPGVLGILSLASAVVGYIACRIRPSYGRHRLQQRVLAFAVACRRRAC